MGVIKKRGCSPCVLEGIAKRQYIRTERQPLFFIRLWFCALVYTLFKFGDFNEFRARCL